MARIVRTARGDLVDFDELLIKQELEAAPMNIEVLRRKNFIDQQETVGRQRKLSPQELTNLSLLKPATPEIVTPATFEDINE